MKNYLVLICSFFLLFTLGLDTTSAQSGGYRYRLNLNSVTEDKIQVELQTPSIESKSIRFFMPNIIPGTYRESNYGRFVTGLKAFSKRGRELPVKKLGKNSWQIDQAGKLAKVTYWVEDTYDTSIENEIYGMSGTNIEAGKNFVIHTPGFFGYFEGMKEQPFEVTITKPVKFYGSTGLIPVRTSDTTDVYRTADYDLLMDSPMMYNEPDTTIIDVANARVLVSVYSPNRKVRSAFLAERYKSLLKAHAEYLGGKLPVDKYAFIMYFSEPAEVQSVTGALEHSYSSFYYLGEMPQEEMAPLLVDIASHEFFHIVTPLNIHSEEIAYFNYNQPDLSRHLWLYEGVTEYAAHHAQVKGGIITGEEFLQRMADKINTSKESYDDRLPFTEMSKKAAGEYRDEFTNVYQKGALIGALLDIALLDISDHKMNLQELIARLSKRFGKEKPFKDGELFKVIASMTGPSIETFFKRYVAGSQSLPYKEYFEKAGIVFEQEADQKVATLGKISIGYDPEQQRLTVADTSGMNEFGRALGWQREDLLISLQGKAIQPVSAKAIFDEYSHSTREGDTVEVVVRRKDKNGIYQEETLRAPALKVTKPGQYTLKLAENPTYKQLKLRNRWLFRDAATARPEDVESIDAIIGALYDVISGPAGKRDWERMTSLFRAEARMGAIGRGESGKAVYLSMTPEDYRQRNEPFFRKNGFWEEEIGREVFHYGEMAAVESAYQFRTAEDGPVQQRGVNSLQLVYERGRWWIVSLIWSAEREDNPVPKTLLEARGAAAGE